MLELEELRLFLIGLEQEITNLAGALGIDRLKRQLEELEARTAAPEFWSDPENSQKVLQQTGQLKNKLTAYQNLVSLYEDTLTMVELALEEKEVDEYPALKESADQIAEKLEEQKLSTLLTGEYDAKNAILTFHAGAGGTEAQDWAQMLYRMYTRWVERHGFKLKLLDMLDGEEAGIKSASILVEGMNAYGYLKSEAGVHRLVRVSPFDASGRRHTSFASLEVMPEIDDDLEVTIDEKDLRIDTYRSSGAGGQHVNKTESAKLDCPMVSTSCFLGLPFECQN